MKIAHKLLSMAIASIVALVVVAYMGFYTSDKLGDALDVMSTNGIGGVRSLNRLKIHQQAMSLSAYRHLSVSNQEKKAEFSKSLEEARQSFEKDMALYGQLTNSVRGKELIKETSLLFADFLAVCRSMLQKSEANDLQGAMSIAAAGGSATAKLTANIDEMIANNVKNSERRVADNHAMAKSNTFMAIVIVLVAVMSVMTLSFITIRSIKRSLKSIQSSVGQIESNLDFTARTEVIGKDEIAEVSMVLNRLINTMQGNLKTIADGVSSAATAASQTTATSTQVSTAAQQQSESASAMAATVEQLTVSINHVGERAQEAARISRESGDMASAGKTAIDKTVIDIETVASTVRDAAEGIQGLERHSQEITNVVAVIKEVADQTNLLALNAAIEAARAGEQGRGFAVVADEVRKLAERTASSTTEISATIAVMRESASQAVESMEKVVNKVAKGVESAQQADAVIRSIGEGSRISVSMVEEISAAICEQATAMNNISAQVENIAQMSEESSAASGHSADTAQNLDRVADNLQQIVSSYKL